MPDIFELTGPDGSVYEVETDRVEDLDAIAADLFGGLAPQEEEEEDGFSLGGLARDIGRQSLPGLAYRSIRSLVDPTYIPEEAETGMGQAKASLEQGSMQAFSRAITGLGTGTGIDAIESFGRYITESAEAIFPQNERMQEEWLTTRIPEMAGQLFSYAAVGRGAMGFGKITSFGSTATFSGLSISSFEYDRAIEQGATEDEAFDTFLLNLPTGILEAIPIGRALRRVDTVTGGGVKKAIARGFVGGLEELTQESLQQVWSNTAAHAVYDEARSITEGLSESAIGGGATGFLLGATLSALGARRLQSRTLDDEAEITQAIRDINPTVTVKKNTVSPEYRFHDIEQPYETPFGEDMIRGNDLTFIISSGGNKLGELNATTMEGSEKLRLRVYDLFEVNPNVRRELVARAFAYAQERGLEIQSNDLVSQTEIELWEDLRTQGFDIVRDEALTLWEYPRNLAPNVGEEQLYFATDSISNPAYRLLNAPEPGEFEAKWKAPASNVSAPTAPLPAAKIVDPRNQTMAMGFPSFGEKALWQRFKLWAIPRLLPSKGLGESTFAKKIEAEGMMQAEFRIAQQQVKDIEKLLIRDYGSVDKVPDTTWESIDSVLRGGSATAPISIEYFNAAMILRQHIDGLSKKGIAEGIFQGDLAASVSANVGFYLHRSYAAKERPSWWRENVPDAVRTNAEAFVRAELAASLGTTPTDAQVNNRLEEILNDNNLWERYSGGNIPR